MDFPKYFGVGVARRVGKCVVTCVSLGGIDGFCRVNRAQVATGSGVDFSVGRKRFIIVLNPDKTKGSAILGVLKKVSSTSRKRVDVSKISVSRFASGTLAACEQESINFIFRFCGLIPGLATGRGIRLTSRVSPRTHSTTRIVQRMNLNRHVSGFPTRLSKNRRRHITVTHTLTGRPGLLLYSRPAKTLSCRANGRILGLLRSAYLSAKAAIVIVARGRTVTTVTGHVVRVGGTGMETVRRGPGPGPMSRVR